MPNIQQLLSEELRRQARKEVRTELVELKTQLTTMRKTIAEQNRRIKALEKIVPLPVKPQPSAEVPAEVKLNSVRYWESGKIEPREAQKRKIATIRDMGKRELAKLMAEKNIVIKLRTPEKSGKPENEQKEQSGKTESETQSEKTANRSQ